MPDAAASSSKGWNIGTWLVQAILALIFVTIGILRMTLPVDPPGGEWVEYADDLPLAILRSIVAVELLGGLGVILPGW